MQAEFRRMLKFLSPLCLAAFLSFAPVQPVKAGVDACLATANELYDLAQLVADKGPRMTSCASQLASAGPVGIGIGGLMGLLYAAGEFSNQAECNAIINTKIAEALLALLDEVPAIKNAMVGLTSEEDVNNLIRMVSTGATEALSSIPALEPILGYITCGCTIVGGAAEIKDQLIVAGQVGAECAAVIGEAVGEVQDFVFGEHKGDWGPSVTVDPDNICKIQVMDASTTEVWPIGFAKKYKGETYYPSLNKTASCTCPEGSNPIENQYTVFCQCEGQRHLEYGADGKAFCAMDCPIGTKKHVGAVNLCLPICAGGSTYSLFGNCNSDCPAGHIYDLDRNQCKPCPENTRAFVNGTTGLGECIECTKGTQAAAGSNSCDSICPGWQDYVNGLCISPCAPGLKVGYESIEVGAKVICQTCAKDTTYNPGTNSCETCPVGATWQNSMIGGICSCPEGMGDVGGVCQPCGKGFGLMSSWTGEADKCVAVESSPPRPQITCTGNAIPDPRNPYTECKTCPPQTRALMGRYCMSTRVTSLFAPPKDLVVSAEDAKTALVNADPRNCPASMKFPDGSCAQGKPGVIRANATRETCKRVAGNSFIPSQLNKMECTPCAQGTQPNIQGNACVQTASVNTKGETKDGRDKLDKQQTKGGGAVTAKSDKGQQKRSLAPDLDLPGPGGSGSVAPSGSSGGSGGFRTPGLK